MLGILDIYLIIFLPQGLLGSLLARLTATPARAA